MLICNRIVYKLPPICTYVNGLPAEGIERLTPDLSSLTSHSVSSFPTPSTTPFTYVCGYPRPTHQ